MKLHAPATRLALLSALFIAVAGCSNMKPTEDHLKTLAETNTGESVSRVSNVRSDSMQTYFTARTSAGDYNCSVPSGTTGGMMAVSTFGLVKPTAVCQLKGTRGNALQPFQ
ncbi:hypothetical protein ASF84_27145 [Pseudomonas sp. Leaf127]|uniref:hypothetical protein n=1 Tax=Pseudomonas TaxID=286 RepID=UPI000702BF74|nr:MULTISPECIES: hypothetical protein [Pseudomonas]KQQ62513.1 hypothetical protein ASF84_27145 [Pseudomonas sp. Leaf127]